MLYFIKMNKHYPPCQGDPVCLLLFQTNYWLYFSEHSIFLFILLQTLKHIYMVNSTQALLCLTHTTQPKYRDKSLCILLKLQADNNMLFLEEEHLQL